MGPHKLYYDKPANLWHDGFPIGNGRLGAMVRGTTNQERLWMNEDSVWYGGPQSRVNPAAKANLPKVRKLLRENSVLEAEQVMMQSFTAMPQCMRHYEPLGDIYINFGHGKDPPGHYIHNTGIEIITNESRADLENSGVQSYRRALDLRTGVVEVSYEYQGARYKRETFASLSDEVVCMRISSDREMSFSVTLDRGDHPEWDKKLDKVLDSIVCSENGHYMTGATGGKGGVEFSMRYKVVPEGDGTVTNDGLDSIVKVNGSAIIVIAGETNFRHEDYVQATQDRIDAIAGKSWAQLIGDHITKFRSLYDRVELTLPGDSKQDIPVDRRLQDMKAGASDTDLAALLFHFGRYLMISSSISGLPANLQGLWNCDQLPTWGSKYTININIEMNYWPTEVCNLSECHETLFAHLERMSKRGEKTARDMYGCRGWCSHHNTDIWADTAPSDRALHATFWNLSGAWFCTHLWEHYLFTHDIEFLRRVFPIMQGAALFFQDYLIEKHGNLVTSPSCSAENTYFVPNTNNTKVGSICEGPAWDSQILTSLFSACVTGGRKLGLPVEDYERVLSKLPQPQVGKHGQIMEWHEDFDEPEPGHRHISQLWGLYPGNSINTDELHGAARKTLERRLAGGGGHTGWSLAWILCLYARLGEAADAENMVNKMLTSAVLPSLLANHPPYQIDGNNGYTAAVAEMLLQSQDVDEGVIRLLPCLPASWEASGSVLGLKARGGVKVGIEWKDGMLEKVELLSSVAQTKVCRIDSKRLRSGKGEMQVSLEANISFVIHGNWD